MSQPLKIAFVFTCCLSTLVFAKQNDETAKTNLEPLYYEAALEFTLHSRERGTTYEEPPQTHGFEYRCEDLDGRYGDDTFDYPNTSHIYFEGKYPANNENVALYAENPKQYVMETKTVQETPDSEMKTIQVKKEVRMPHPHKYTQALQFASRFESVDAETDFISFVIKHHIQATISIQTFGYCEGNKGDSVRFPEKAALTGKFKLSYLIPEGVQFLKVTPRHDLDNGFLKIEKISEVTNTIQGIFPDAESEIIWIAFRESTKERRVEIVFDYGEGEGNLRAEDLGASTSGTARRSDFAVTFEKISFVTNHGLSDANLLRQISINLSKNWTPELLVTRYIGEVLHKSASFKSATRDIHSPELAKIGQVVFDYSLRATKGNAPITPILKAATTVLSTMIARELADRLMPHCAEITQTVPVVSRSITAPRFLFTIFWMNRLAQRMYAYDIPKTLAVVEAFEKLSRFSPKQNGYTQAFDAASAAFSEYQDLQGRNGRPFLTASGEIARFVSLSDFPQHQNEVPAFVSSLSNTLNEAKEAEANMQKAIADYARAIMGYDGIKKPSIKKLKSLKAQLVAAKRTVLEQANTIAESVYYTKIEDLNFESQYDQLFSSFEGLAGTKLWADQELNANSYVARAMDFFFTEAERLQLNKHIENAKQCMAGGIR
jgi:hypothetical protein